MRVTRACRDRLSYGAKNPADLASRATFKPAAGRIERHDVIALWSRLKVLHADLSAYDAHYVALAEALRLPLITADARILRSGAATCAVEVAGAPA